MKVLPLVFLIGLAGAAHAQEEPAVSPEDQTVIFAGFVAAVAAVFAYLARDMILRKKTDYDEQDLGSKEDKEYEKYHSDWGDDYEDLGDRTRRFKERFRRMSGDEGLPDLYAIMGMERDATPDQIKRQYRKLAKESHPDRSSEEGAKERMAEINLAYEILSDPEQREEYDRYFSS